MSDWICLAIGTVAVVLIVIGAQPPKPWTPPGTGTRRDHRAAYGKKGFRI